MGQPTTGTVQALVQVTVGVAGGPVPVRPKVVLAPGGRAPAVG
jgi:hypothetical protein